MLLELLKSTINPPKKLTTTLFNENFIDIHSHILPGVDDGAASIEDALNLMKKMRSFGIQNFVFTPHVMNEVWENSTERIMQRFHEFKFHVEQEPGLENVTMRVAAEYMLDENFLHLLETKDLLTVKDNMILVELSFMSPPMNLFRLLAEIQKKGYIPILAHPERYLSFHHNFGMYCKLKTAGCLFQVNLLSLSSYYNKEVQDTALWLIRNNLIDYLGTDIHKLHQMEAVEELLGKFSLIELVKPLVRNNYQLL
jgi:protein-tyrosine phosphatase